MTWVGAAPSAEHHGTRRPVEIPEAVRAPVREFERGDLIE